VTQSQLLLNLADWMDRQTDPDSAPVRATAANATSDFDAVSPAPVWMYSDPRAKTVLKRWWEESVLELLHPAITAGLASGEEIYPTPQPFSTRI
jgi:hypothetical protein